METCSTPFGVGDLLSGVDGCGLSGLPVHAIEDDQKDVLFAGGGSRHLDVVDIGLIEIVGVVTQGGLGQAAVHPLKFCFATIGTVGTGVAGQINARAGVFRPVGIDWDQAVGMAGPLRVFGRIDSPMTE